jgi:hypothetical protein
VIICELLYILLVKLHPSPFRERFGGEMLTLWREAVAENGAPAFLTDAVVSLIRQWSSTVYKASDLPQEISHRKTSGLMAGQYSSLADTGPGPWRLIQSVSAIVLIALLLAQSHPRIVPSINSRKVLMIRLRLASRSIR